MSINQVLSYAPEAEIVGLYFSAEYCKFCKHFTPILESVYPHLQDEGIEIVLIGSDKTELAYNAYKKTHPWAAMAFDDPTRSEMRAAFGIKTIPALVFVAANGGTLKTDGRDIVAEAYGEMGDPKFAADAIASIIRSEKFECDYDSDDESF